MRNLIVGMLALTAVGAVAEDFPFWYGGTAPNLSRTAVASADSADGAAFESRIFFSRESDPFDCSTFPLGFLLFLR